MELYESFAREALESYAKLPEEANELYKRHHIPLSKMPAMTKGQDDKIAIDRFMHLNSERMAIQFDAIIGSSSHLINNPTIKVDTPEESPITQKEMLHKNSDDKYVSFINAHSRRFITINVPKGKQEELKLLFVETGTPLLAHIFINTADNSSLKLVEMFSSEGNSSVMGMIHEIKSGSYTNVELDAIHNENSNTILLSFCRNSMGEDSKLTYNSFYNGSNHTRVKNIINAEATRCQVNVGESILGASSQKFDINTQILNSGRESHASLDTKAVMMDNSFCIMKGYAKVRKGATNSRSYVHQRGIILDKGARVDGLPDMSVDEPEVKATHSSATSPIDPETIFYLMSKGVDEIGVRKLIVSGFLGEGISKMHNDKLRQLAMTLVNHKLETKEFGIIPKSDARNVWMFGEDRDKDMFMGHYKYR